MTSDDACFLPIEELAPLLTKKKISPVELVEIFLARIEGINPLLNAYLTVTADRARHEARRAEAQIMERRYRGPLHGIPIALKDNIWTRGIRTTAGAKFLADFLPEEDATVVRRLRRAGAILLGKTNLHEFAYGVTTVNPHYGPTRNPWDTSRIPGGSSGGSAAAIAAGLCSASIGTDTGGSIRIPAALCGIAGLKPSFGRVSCFGVVPLAKSLDHTGPLTRTVTDAALLLEAIAGRDPRDPTTISARLPEFRRELGKPPGRVCLGVPREYFWEKLDDEVRRICEAALESYRRLGVRVEEISLPGLLKADEPSTAIALAEARTFHEATGWFPKNAAEYSEESRQRLELGAAIRATDYLRALEFRERLRAEFAAAFERVDAIVAPTTPIAAPPIGEKMVRIGSEEEAVRAALLRLNRPANFTGLPAISIPCGFTAAGLPAGLQLISPPLDEARLLRIAVFYEKAHNWHTRRPPAVTLAADMRK
jgi:aspartyl-tRNA(Asn)/glutamyl-tRNA(Gln) amidotransferase subunit A